MAPGPDDEIRHNAPEPPYRQLAEILAARIRRGDWSPRHPIPSESQLMGTYGVARGTVRRAVKLLVEEGLVFTVTGRGTYVTEKPKR
ncbi:MAG: GntR family transcriptional regulator [Actinopolymorphaceae bacterium]|jgi:GntR family transcriptional regulator